MFKQNADKCRGFPSKDFKSEDEGGRGYRSLHDFAESSYLQELRSVLTSPELVEGLCISCSPSISLYLLMFGKQSCRKNESSSHLGTYKSKNLVFPFIYLEPRNEKGYIYILNYI